MTLKLETFHCKIGRFKNSLKLRVMKIAKPCKPTYIGFYGVSCSMYRGYPSTNLEVIWVINTVISSDPLDRNRSVCYLPVFNIS